MKNKDVKRIFIGIPVGPQIKSILPLIKSTINCDSSLIKWESTENIHLTLTFLGNIYNHDIPNIILLIEHNITIAQFQLSISNTGIFPSQRSPKVLWIGIEKGINKLRLLHYQISRSLKKYIVNYENNTFIPHITIARIKHAFWKIDVLPFLNIVYSPIELEVNSICMYESKLSSDGGQYAVLNTFPLID